MANDYSWIGDIGNAVSQVAFKMPEVMRYDRMVKERADINKDTYNALQTFKRGVFQNPDVLSDIKNATGAKDDNEVAEYLNNVFRAPKEGEENTAYARAMSQGVADFSRTTRQDPGLIQSIYRSATDPTLRGVAKQLFTDSQNYNKIAQIAKDGEAQKLSPSDLMKRFEEAGGPDGTIDLKGSNVTYFANRAKDAYVKTVLEEWSGENAPSVKEMTEQAAQAGISDSPEIANLIRQKTDQYDQSFSADNFDSVTEALRDIESNGGNIKSPVVQNELKNIGRKEAARGISSGLIDWDLLRAEGKGAKEAFDEWMRSENFDVQAEPYIRRALADMQSADELAERLKIGNTKAATAYLKEKRLAEKGRTASNSDLVQGIKEKVTAYKFQFQAYDDIASDKTKDVLERQEAKIKANGVKKAIGLMLDFIPEVRLDKPAPFTSAQVAEEAEGAALEGERESVVEDIKNNLREASGFNIFSKSDNAQASAKKTVNELNNLAGGDVYTASDKVIERDGKPVAEIVLVDGEPVLRGLGEFSGMFKDAEKETPVTPKSTLESFMGL